MPTTIVHKEIKALTRRTTHKTDWQVMMEGVHYQIIKYDRYILEHISTRTWVGGHMNVTFWFKHSITIMSLAICFLDEVPMFVFFIYSVLHNVLYFRHQPLLRGTGWHYKLSFCYILFLFLYNMKPMLSLGTLFMLFYRKVIFHFSLYSFGYQLIQSHRIQIIVSECWLS